MSVETLIGIIVTGILTFFSGVALVKLQQQRRLLAFEVLTAELIIPELPPNSGLHLMAKAGLLQPKGELNEQELLPVKALFGFRVKIVNGGNVPLEKQRVSIHLDDEARIISLAVESGPDLGEESIGTSIDANQANKAYAVLPFLNPKSELILSLQSVDNANLTCRVSAGGVGLIVRDEKRFRRRLANLSGAAFIVGALAFIAVVVLAGDYYTSPNETVLKEASGDGIRGWSLISLQLLNAALFIGGIIGVAVYGEPTKTQKLGTRR